MTEEGIYTFENPEIGRLRILKDAENHYFCLKDAGRALAIKNYRSSFDFLVKKYKEFGVDTKGVDRIYTLLDEKGGPQESKMIREDTFLDFLIQSKKPAGFKMKLWVTRDILPAIRKHGVYSPEDMIQQFMTNPDSLLAALKALYEEQQKRIAAESQLRESEPLVHFAKKCIKSDDCLMVREFAKVLTDKDFNIGQNRLYKVLRDNKYLLKDSTEPSQRAMNSGFLVREQIPYEEEGKGVRLHHLTKITPRGQAHLVFQLLNDSKYRKFRPEGKKQNKKRAGVGVGARA